MIPLYPLSLFIFRRDLRLQDNSALNEALRLSKRVIPCFIFDPAQINPHPYQSLPGLRFMLQSIHDLELQCRQAGGRLALHHASPVQVIRDLSAQRRIQAVFFNRDYTPFSRRRDQELAQVCSELGIALHVLPDALLNEPEDTLKSDGTPYKVFTAFYNHARQFPVPLSQALTAPRFLSVDTGFTLDRLALPVHSPLAAGIKAIPGANCSPMG